MPVNEFEKQVQQKMDELQLRPSDNVWQEVERRIRKEKKRRFLIWFFLAAALLLGGTGWWMINTKQSPEEKIVHTANKGTSTTGSVAEADAMNRYSKEQHQDKAEKINATNPPAKITADPEKGNITGTDKKMTPAIKTQQDRKGGRKTKIGSTRADKEEKEPVSLPVRIDSSASASVPVTLGVVIQTSSPTREHTDTTATANDKKMVADLKPMDTAIAKTSEPTAKKDSSKTKKKNWEIGITGFAGTSARTDGLSLFGGMKSTEVYSQGAANPGGPPAAIINIPGPGKGFSWQLGIYAKKKLAERTGLAIGLNFSLYSVKQPTGVYVDSTGLVNTGLYSSSFNSFYRVGKTRTNTNRYYYLQVPLSFHWQLNKSRKLPVIFHNGLTAGIYMGSDALVYSPVFNGFYEDKKSFNRLQVIYQTGLYTKLFSQAKHPVTIGLSYNYHLGGLQKTNVQGGNHLSSFGVQLGWILKK